MVDTAQPKQEKGKRKKQVKPKAKAPRRQRFGLRYGYSDQGRAVGMIHIVREGTDPNRGLCGKPIYVPASADEGARCLRCEQIAIQAVRR